MSSLLQSSSTPVLWVSPDIITKPILIVHFTIDQSNILWLTDWLMVNQMIEWLTDWLRGKFYDWITTEWITVWLSDWLTHCVIVRLTDSLTGLLVDGLTFGLTNQLTNWCALFDWLNEWHVYNSVQPRYLWMDLPTEWLTCEMTLWVTDPLSRLSRLTDWMIDLLIEKLTK